MRQIITLITVLSFGLVFGQKTTIPDTAFEQALIDLGYDKKLNGKIRTKKISEIQHLKIDNLKIEDLKGIEDFGSLKTLNCSNNRIKELNIGENTSLIKLECNGNELTSLDVSNNTALTYISCNDNLLTEIDVGSNTFLTSLYCANNQLSSLDVSKNTSLKYLSYNSNQLTEIDVSKNTSLVLLYCDDNQLSSLDLSKNTSLSILSCKHNNFDHKTIQTQFESRKKEREIYDVTEIKPQFIGGDLSEFLKKNIVYPKLAKENGIQGKVFVQFIVWKDGTIRDVKVIKGVHETLDNEAIRIVQMMPKWKPGKQRGKAVNARFTLPIPFKYDY